MANKLSGRSVRKLNVAIIATCMAGFAATYYVYHVEVAKGRNDSYEPMCDISEHVSCTKAFSSEYGKGFGIIPETSALYAANPIYGFIFYILVTMLSMSNWYFTSAMTVALAFVSNLGTFYLAYVLYLLNNICVVCVSMYVINAVLLILAVKKHRRLFQNGTTNKKKKSK